LAGVDVLVVPSIWLENAPLVISEAFLAGVPVVGSNIGGIAEMVAHDVNGLLFEPGNSRALRDNLQRLVDEPDLLPRLRAGIPPVRSLRDDAACTHDLYVRLAASRRAQSRASRRSDAARPRVSIVIPTLNAGADLEASLRMIFSQATRWPIEVIVVDSGSSDDTVAVARKFPVRLFLIPRERFGHGRTRQWAIEQAAGDYVAFLSQDAIPADEHWLAPLVEALESDPEVAGAYSRQLPKPGCDAIARARVERWLTGRTERVVTQIRSRADYDDLPPWNKRLFINFDDVSSMVRADLMQRFPLADVPFGEDLEWSRRVLEGGFKVVFEPGSRVYHSHATSLRRNYTRAFVDHRSMKAELGVDFYAQMFSSSPLKLAAATLDQIAGDLRCVAQSDMSALSKLKWMASAPIVEVAEKAGCLLGAAAARRQGGGNRAKILLVSHDFPPDREGGVAVFTRDLARALGDRHDVHVFHRTVDRERPAFEIRRYTSDGVAVTSINNPACEDAQDLIGTNDQRVDRAFRRLLRDEEPDVVHFQYLGGGLSLGLVGEARRVGIPTVATLNDYWLMCPRGQMMSREWRLCSSVVEAACAQCVSTPHEPLLHVLRPQSRQPSSTPTRTLRQELWVQRVRRRNRRARQVLNSMDALIAPSQFLRQKYVEFGVSPQRLSVLAYGMNTAKVGRRRTTPSGQLVFGYLGTWMPTKGVHVLLDAFRDIPETEAELRVYGAPPNFHHDEYAAAIAQKAEGRKHIRLLGRYSPDRVGEILAGLDVLVVPSIWHENAPLTIQEAFMAGLPVVTSNIGGMAEAVRHLVDGLHFKVGDARDLRDAIIMLVRDPELVRRLASNTPAVKSMADHVAELEGIYQRLSRSSRAAVFVRKPMSAEAQSSWSI